MTLQEEIKKRRTFAIISHPDAGKTTITEQLLKFGGAIREAGTVKARKTGNFAKSDWMDIEKERGISVTSLAIPRISSNSESKSSGSRPSRSSLLMKVKTGIPLRFTTWKSFFVCASIPLALSITMTAASTVINLTVMDVNRLIYFLNWKKFLGLLVYQ